MAPSEESILCNFLLAPASLPTILSLQKFTELFPKRLRAHPQVKVLYRELQELREQDMDLVNKNIDQELQRGAKQKQELRKAQMNSGVDGMDADDRREMDIDIHLFGEQQQSLPADEYHGPSSLLSSIEAACVSVEHEIKAIDQEAATILSGLNATVGEL
ncbi:hypothetical protein ASPZODRAFT_135489, partial [Penicilliopsis zonata CBS 506.65]